MPYIRRGNTPDNHFLGHVASQDELGPTMVALANASGGSIVLGMDVRNFHLYGSELMPEWVATLVSAHTVPRLAHDCHVIERGDKHLLLITVEAGKQKPYFYKGECFLIDQQTGELSVELAMSPVVNPIEEVTPVLVNQPEEPSLATVPEVSTPAVSVVEQVAVPVQLSIRKRIDTNGLNRRQKKALTYLQKRQSIRNKKYRELYGVSHKTAHIELVEMLERNIVVQVGAGRSTRYVLKEKIDQAAERALSVA